MGTVTAEDPKLISKSRISDLRDGGKRNHVSARRLSWLIRELQAALTIPAKEA